MLNKESCKGKHLQMEERLIVEYALEQNYTLKELAQRIQKDPTTISKEIKRNRFLKISNLRTNDLSSCQHRKGCTKTNLCKSSCNKQCKKCTFINCYRNCSEYSIKEYSKLSRYPYVCNGCSAATTCKSQKQYYKAKTANAKYKETLGDSVFKSTFPVILTDNGSEFKNPQALEFDIFGKARTEIFYCNQMTSYQKPHVEKNHEYLRYIIPKEKSFDNRTQEDITLMINHVNSAARASLNGNIPFKVAQIFLDNSLLDKLSLHQLYLIHPLMK